MPFGENVGDVSRPFSEVNCTTFIEGSGGGAGRPRGRSPIAAPITITITAAPTTAVRRLERRSLRGHQGARNPLKLEFDLEHPVEAPVLDLFQAALDEFPQTARCTAGVRRRSRSTERQGGWICVENVGHDIFRGAAGKRRASRNHLVERAAKREDIASGIRLLAAHLFGRHVLWSAGDDTPSARVRVNGGWHSGFDDPRYRLEPGEPEVEQLRLRLPIPGRAAVHQHDVGRLQIAVHDTLGMCRVECFSDLNAEPHGLGNRQWASAQPGRQRFAVQILHHEEVDAIVMPEVVERTDVRMREPRDRPRLVRKAGAAA